MNENDIKTINRTRDAARGFVAVNACTNGWPSIVSVHMGRVAEPAITARLITGVEAGEAIGQSVMDVELMAAVEVFAKAMAAKNGTPDKAFQAVMAIKRKSLADVPGANDALDAAETSFRSAIDYGMTPYAALIAANIAASAAMKLISKSQESVN